MEEREREKKVTSLQENEDRTTLFSFRRGDFTRLCLALSMVQYERIRNVWWGEWVIVIRRGKKTQRSRGRFHDAGSKLRT